MIKALGVLCACLVLAACSGGGGDSSTATTTTTTATTTTTTGSTTTGTTTTTGSTTTTPVVTQPLTNFTAITVDDGPAALNTGADAYTATNQPFVSVTICAPGATNCQTIDHVLLDTGSIGLRIYASVINASVLSALTNQTDGSSNPVGECYGFVDGYIFGSVRQADFQVGGETVANMPFQAISDTGRFASVPSSCSSGGGSNLNTVQSFGANGVLGVGVTATDCGSACTSTGGSGAAIYYDCPATGCVSIITRASSTAAPFQQLPNPVAAMSVDNNGTIISLPAVRAAESSLSGVLYFGIGTQTNNALGAASVLTTTGSSSASGAGLITAVYNGANLAQSFLDSGSNLYVFVDRSISTCSVDGFAGYYCPASSLLLSPTLKGQNGVAVSGAFTLVNARTALATSSAVIPGIGGTSRLFGSFNTISNSFDFGLPFFYGRNVYTAIEGRNAGGTTGPYFAF
jgi:hypothetical protein